MAHHARKGKICPKRADLPERYHELLDWYEKEYCSRQPRQGTPNPVDFILEMRGVGKEIWSDLGADAFIEAQRSEWDLEKDSLEERIWKRIVSQQGKVFRTKTGLLFTYSVEGDSGIWFYHESGSRIEMRLWRGQLKEAIYRCQRGLPDKVTDFEDLLDPSYLFGVLTDPRIRSVDW
jgi:hypothetical protein